MPVSLTVIVAIPLYWMVGHGLTAAPDLMLVKNRDAADSWRVYHSGNTTAPETDYLVLDTNVATADDNTIWNDTAPTASVFSLGTDGGVNTSTEKYMAYCWHSVPGYSQFGYYEGNGDADGPFVYTGFRPAFVMVKSIDSTSSWFVYDSIRNVANPTNLWVVAEDPAAEPAAVTHLDLVSNGFKFRIATVDPNVTETYIYAAFAEQPHVTGDQHFSRQGQQARGR